MTTESEPHVAVTVEDGAAWVTLRNPTRKNAITATMCGQLVEICDRLDADPAVGAAVITGAGAYFCSGADTRDLAAASANPASADGVRRTSAVYGAFVRFGELRMPTVALVRGGAVGAGLNLAMAADVLIAAHDAVLDSGFLARSIHPGGGHLAMAGRSMSRQDTMAFAAFGAPLSGRDAVRRGLAWTSVEADALADTAAGLVRLAAADPELARRVKTSAQLELGPPAVGLAAGLEIERGVQMWSLARKGEAGWSRPREAGTSRPREAGSSRPTKGAQP